MSVPSPHGSLRPTGLLTCFGSLLLATSSFGQEGPAQDQVKGKSLEETSRSSWEFLSEKYDKDGDGKVSADEYDRGKETFDRLDANGDGFITAEDAKSRRRERPQMDKGQPPKVGDAAPDFHLDCLPPPPKTEAERKIAEHEANKQVLKEGQTKVTPRRVRLSEFKDKKPVALIFGSYT
ncbi:hypothetical protein CMO84_04585 [Candidatus Woesearchaeota archaeon]|nr:hypothetical protein [Candidatus Woesearchaeota archaeon]